MNKRYMDFVPAKKTVKKVAKPVAKESIARSAEKKPVSKAVVRDTKNVVKTEAGKKPVLGVVEDLNQNFVNTKVSKRPLGQKEEDSGLALARLKAQKIKNTKLTAASRSMEKSEKVATKDGKKVSSQVGTKTLAGESFKPPMTTFINQEKVVKRPLSKNVYQKKTEPVVESSETAKAPVTIISKPEKDAHVSIIVTIIITIVLGAAAGTVAFLLLPR